MDEELDLVWMSLLNGIHRKVSEPQYNAFFKYTRLVLLIDSLAIIQTPSAFAKDWLESRFTKLIQREIKELLGREPDILFTE